MPYITIRQSPAYHQITFDEIITGKINIAPLITSNESNTRTHFSEFLDYKFLEKFNYEKMIKKLEEFCKVHEHLYEVDRESLYETFHIPKKTGGFREINAPCTELMNALRMLKALLEEDMMALYHTSAFAYVPGRSTIDAVKKHQFNQSNWFLKTDFSNFFGNTTPKFLLHMLSMIFPFSQIVKYQSGRIALEKALDLCFLKGGLPQGTPISPMLTNLMMIPIDHRLSNELRKIEGKHYVYTRYADDIQISSRCSFNHREVVEYIQQVLKEFEAPFSIKEEKTRYGSRSGSNWNLGVMLNKDNQITVGHKNKQRFRASINNYILDRRNGVKWDLHDVQVLSGMISYYGMVEPEYVNNVISFNNEKYQTDVMRSIKEDLS